MSFDNASGIGVFNHYGPRDTGGTVGVETDKDGVHQLSIYFTGESVNGAFISPFVMPKGAKPLRYLLTVDEAFALSGTSPTVQFGSKGSVGTNGVTLTKTELESTGVTSVTTQGNGTWATSGTGVSASAEIDQQLGGTLPVVDPTVGKATLTVEYLYKVRG